MSNDGDWRRRAQGFCEQFGGQVPLLLAPMAGACPPGLSVAVMQAGGWGAAGALLMSPEDIAKWCASVREASDGPFQLNLWIPEPERCADDDMIAAQVAFLKHWTDDVGDPESVGGPDFAAQCDALIEAKPAAISSIMGVYAPEFVEKMKASGIAWFATATTLDEARIAADAGADAIVAQGAEAGGHRGSFDPALSERDQCGLFALLPAIVDAVDVPVIATGGIADARGAAAAFMLGAAAVQIGTGFLRADESDATSMWKDALASAQPGDTMLTRAYTGRSGRALATRYALAAASPDAPPPAPHPIQRGLTRSMTRSAKAANDLSRMQAWAGQSARLARSGNAAGVARALWQDTLNLIG